MGDFLQEKSLPLPSVRYDLDELIERINNIDENKIEFRQGQLYKVDIPATDVLLDENLPFSKQSLFVKKALRKLFKDKGLNLTEEMKTGYVNGNPKGASLYSEIQSLCKGSAKEASKLLNEYGIKGITYDGQQDGRCYVIFDDKAIKVLETYYQGENEEHYRGKTTFNKNETIIELAQGHDASTFMHELAHIYLHDLQELAKTNKRAEKDLQELYNKFDFNSSNYTEEEFKDFDWKVYSDSYLIVKLIDSNDVEKTLELGTDYTAQDTKILYLVLFC